MEGRFIDKERRKKKFGGREMRVTRRDCIHV